MSETPHHRYQRRLAALEGDDRILDAIGTVGVRRGWWPEERSWTRTFERFHPGAQPFATLVYQSDAPTQAIAKIEVFDGRPAALTVGEEYRLDRVLGWLRLMPFHADPQLPGLAATLAVPGQVEVLRYRPGRRCTLRHTGPSGVRFAKVFASAAGREIHAAGEALWAHAERGDLAFAVARPDHWDEDAGTLWQHPVAGHPIMPGLGGPGAAELAFRMGIALGSLGESTLRPVRRFDAADQLQRTHRAARELGRLVPRLAEPANLKVAELAAFHAARTERPLRPVHGAPHASQWLQSPRGLGLVDFDRFSWGDPELDQAVFLGELDYEEGLAPWAEQIEVALVAGYETVAPRLDRALLQTYRAHKRLGKALRAARALRADGDIRAEAHLHGTFACR